MLTRINDISLRRIDGSPDRLSQHLGKVLLIVNVASKCGLTSQYAGLEALYRARQAVGLEILGFPANNFKAQEPGSDEEIAAFCSLTYDVTFPIFSKVSVKGPDIHPLYSVLTKAAPHTIGAEGMRKRLEQNGLAGGDSSEVLWNFEKFVIARDGRVVARFSPDVTADDPRLGAVIDRELGNTAPGPSEPQAF